MVHNRVSVWLMLLSNSTKAPGGLSVALTYKWPKSLLLLCEAHEYYCLPVPVTAFIRGRPVGLVGVVCVIKKGRQGWKTYKGGWEEEWYISHPHKLLFPPKKILSKLLISSNYCFWNDQMNRLSTFFFYHSMENLKIWMSDTFYHLC